MSDELTDDFYGGGAPAWARHLRDDPSKRAGKRLADDEKTWGQTQSLVLAAPGTGIFAADSTQIVQATRPARTWNIDVAFSLPSVNALPNPAAYTVTVTFIIMLGVGQGFITKYLQLFNTDLVGFAFNPSFPAVLTPPIASTMLENVPARQVIVSAHVEFQRVTLAGPASLTVNVSAAAAPVFR